MSLPRFVSLPVMLSPLVLGVEVSFTQEYPSKTVRIVAASAGSGGDSTARLIASGISGPLGQPVIVENRGTGFIPAEVVAKSPFDGYTVLVQGGSAWVNPLLQKAPYDAQRDFSPIILISRDVNVLAVHPALPVKSVKELIALAKARPGDLNYASASSGSTNHLAAELFKSITDTNIMRVPYNGGARAVTSLISGETQVIIMDAGLVLPHAKSGRLRALAVTSGEPTRLAPGLPTLTSSGVPGYESTGVTGMLAPAKTPTAAITRLNQELMRLISRQEVKDRFFDMGAETVGSTPDQFTAKMKSDIVKWSKVIKDAGIKAD